MFCSGVYCRNYIGRALQRLQPLLEHRVFGNVFRMQPHLDPFCQPDARHLVDIARSGPESELVQRVSDLPIRTRALIESTGRVT